MPYNPWMCHVLSFSKVFFDILDTSGFIEQWQEGRKNTYMNGHLKH